MFFPPVIGLTHENDTVILDLRKVEVAAQICFIGYPARKVYEESAETELEDEENVAPAPYTLDTCPHAVVVTLQGERPKALGRKALAWMNLDGRALERAFTLFVKEHMWDASTDWKKLRAHVVERLGFMCKVSEHPDHMTREEEELLVWAGIGEHDISLCKTNNIRPMPTVGAFLAMSLGDQEFDVKVGEWDFDAQMIAVATGARALDVSLAKKNNLKFVRRQQHKAA